jgi:hypothetical protein
MQTLLLDTVSWDLALDVNGNIAVASPPYALAQDAASAARTFLNEVYYATAFGMPYWEQILGQLPPLSLVKSKYVAIAKTVPGVTGAKCYLNAIHKSRRLTGQIQITDAAGNLSAIGF